MITKFIEATDGTHFNWGKFAVCRFTEEEWARRSALSDTTAVSESGRPTARKLLPSLGWSTGHVLVVDLATGEGSLFWPKGLASADLNEKHQIWVCPMFEPFLGWLYAQDLSNLEALPGLVNLGDVPTSMQGYRRTRSIRIVASQTREVTPCPNCREALLRPEWNFCYGCGMQLNWRSSI